MLSSGASNAAAPKRPPPLLLLVLLVAVAINAAQGALWSAVCDRNQPRPNGCNVTSGNATDAVAWADYTDARNTTGWAFLQIATRPHDDEDTGGARYAAGYLEGYVTWRLIWYHYSNVMAKFFRDGAVPQPLVDFLNANDQWVIKQINTNFNPNDKLYWQTVNDLYAQLDGLAAGYQAAAPPSMSISRLGMLIVNLQGDLGDIMQSLTPSHQRTNFANMSKAEVLAYDLDRTHCSAIVKLLPDGSELYTSHTMWWDMYAMNRVFRTATFPRKGVPAPVVQQSSYPGTIASTDDFYQMPDTRLVSMETTNPNYNNSLFDLITPNALMYWVRVMVANAIATNGKDWTDVFGQYNSGTYNNMWMVVDYKLFQPRQPLPPNVLWVSEQLPGYYHAEDMTTVLRYGYWPSYNKALFPETSRLCGQDAMVAKNGVDFSYQLTPRAEVFRRDQANVKDVLSLQRFIRYNQYQTDPLAKGNPCNQIACRGDLMSRAAAAVDAKVTSSSMLALRKVEAVSGPTHDDQPVFCWSTAPTAVQQEPHLGQPDCFNFDWVVVTADL